MDHLQTESRNPASTDLDRLSASQFVRVMLGEDAKVVPAVATQAEKIARAIDVIAERWQRGGRLVYIGAGTSGRLGVLDASECPPTFNVPPTLVVGVIAGGAKALTSAIEGAEDKPDAAVRDLEPVALTANDVLVGIATSGRTPYVLAALEHARGRGSFTIALSCNPDGEIIDCADLAITPVVGPEVLTGSTRLKAGTATKLVLNLLTTGAMVRMGKTYGDLMVDLRATNEKLRQRANRIIRMATNLDHAAAEALLHASGREVKTALVSQLAGVSVEEARVKLAASGERVREAIGEHFPGAMRLEPSHGELILGIDGGGTKTIAVLAERDGTIIGRGDSGPSNLRAVGEHEALSHLELAVHRAFLDACYEPGRVASACLGLSGAGRPEERAIIERWASEFDLAERVRVVTDTELPLGTGWGVAVVAGTGSMVFARSHDGRTTRAGGWGGLLGDEGSGYAVALAALRAVVRAADGRGPATKLTDAVLDELGLDRADQLVGALSTVKAEVAALAPLVIDVARRGDAVSSGILDAAAGELALAVAAAQRSLGLEPGFPLFLAGGLLTASSMYRDSLMRSLSAAGLRPDPLRIVTDPAEGALALAAAALHEGNGQ